MPNIPVFLKGALLLNCQTDGDSLNLRFDTMQRLVVHNNWQLRDFEGREVAESALIGTTVTDLQTSDLALRVEFGLLVLNVDLSAAAWKGPEAAVLYEDNRPVVVWS